MELIFIFAVFMALMIGSVIVDISMIVPLAIGIVLFCTAALHRGHKLGTLIKMLLKGASEALVVVKILLLIGCLTGLWRAGGTIAYMTYFGVKCVPPHMFILAVFLLSSLMSYLLGTSFGVTATVGVILIAIARAGGVSPVIAGGAILSGVYFGDRGSPAASSASLVAHVTQTDLTKNIRLMLKSSAAPMLICAAFYAVLSIFNSLAPSDSTLLSQFESEFALSPWCLVPAIVLLVLSFAGLRIDLVMAIDIVLSFLLSLIVQNLSPVKTLQAMLLGFTPAAETLKSILSGGGVSSMLEVSVILLLSSACAGVFRGTGMLSNVEEALKRLSDRIGRFPAMVVSSIMISAVFCNQTIGIIMCRQCMSRAYSDSEAERSAMMLDIEDSIVTISGLIPWCIACSVPLGMLGCKISSLPFAMYLYILPLCHFIGGRRKARKSTPCAGAHDER